MVMKNYEKAKSLLEENIETLHAMANELLEREVLDGKEIDRIIEEHRSPAPAEGAADGE